jgi:hypothetical protein
MEKSIEKKPVMTGRDEAASNGKHQALAAGVMRAFSDPQALGCMAALCVYETNESTLSSMNQLAQATLKALNNCEDKQQFMLLYTLSIIENTANDTSRKDRVKNAIEQSKKMSEAAKARHNDSDHARAKAEIKQKWLKDRESIIARHGGKAKFYDDMQKQYQIKGVDENGKEIDVNLIRDLKTIQGWVAKWEKELL